MYTGEPKGTFADEGLFQLAEKYHLESLIISCEYALKLKETEAPPVLPLFEKGVP
jgi:hypothetical protein